MYRDNLKCNIIDFLHRISGRGFYVYMRKTKIRVIFYVVYAYYTFPA